MPDTIADKPWFGAIPMHCRSCGSDYAGWMIAGCTLRTAAAYMREMTCPLCAADAAAQFIRNAPDA